MASTNTSYNRKRHGFIRVENGYTHETCDYSLYGSVSVPSAIDVALEGAVIENSPYSFSVLLPSTLPVFDLSVRVNDSDPMTAFEGGRSSEIIANEEFSVTPIKMNANTPGERGYPFSLTYGFARIEVILTLQESADSKVVLTTKDIPCLSNEDYQSPMISQMLNELLDAEEETVTKWMFVGNKEHSAAFSIIDVALRDNSPKSLSSIIQLFEASIVEYENSYVYFRSHGFSKIASVSRKLSPRMIRRTGSHELLWMAKNSHVLSETPYETSVNYLGRYFLPREVETDVQVKSHNSYENQLVLGFLDELLANAKSIYFSLKNDAGSVKELEKRLSPLKRDGYSLPALTLISQCVDRENYYIAKLQNAIDGLQKLKRRYESALPGVKAAFTRAPKRTKVFQEVKCYSNIYTLMLKWLKFGDFTLARENLALHTLRLDKLYEYYALFRLLCWFHKAGFSEDSAEKIPIEQALYTLVSRHYSNEKQVATVYRLARGKEHIRLYYQPVIYGDDREEHGITLHRLSYCRSEFNYWMPDFMLMVDRGQGETEWHIFDAKYRKATALWNGYPKNGPFTEAISKYKTDIRGRKTSDRVSSVWLFSGRERGRNTRFAERSTWASNNYMQPHSGIGALTPSYSCLDEVLLPILGLTSEDLWGSDIVCPIPKEGFISQHPVKTLAAPTSDVQPASIAIRRVRRKPSNRCLPLIVELYNIVEDSDLLFKSRWSEANLGIAHPLLRKSAPKGREGRYYAKAEVGGAACYAYNNWLPNYENKLRLYVEKHRVNGPGDIDSLRSS